MLLRKFVKFARSGGDQFACKGFCYVGLSREVGDGDRWLIVSALSGGELENSPEDR